MSAGQRDRRRKRGMRDRRKRRAEGRREAGGATREPRLACLLKGSRKVRRPFSRRRCELFAHIHTHTHTHARTHTHTHTHTHSYERVLRLRST